jgi:hypothetical protein
MPRRIRVFATIGVLASLSALTPAEPRAARGEGPTAPQPLHGLLIAAERATPEALAAWKAEGGNAVLVPLDEAIATPRGRWAELAGVVAREGLALYPWIEVARNPVLADAHPEWMAAPGGHHDDWRRRFPGAPAAAPGTVIKAWPWVPIGYAPAFEAHRRRLRALLDDLPGPWAGAFLNDLQAGPSSCGCGNDQCRWALDYGTPATAPRTPGDDAAARLVAELQGVHSGKAIIPVWVTECEMIDLPRVAGSTGHCGGVECARNDCWPRYARNLNPLLKAASGPVAVALWSGPFERGPGWIDTGLSLFAHPPRGDAAVPPERTIAVLQAWDTPEPDHAALIAQARRARGGWVLARTRVDQSWQPRRVDQRRTQ